MLLTLYVTGEHGELKPVVTTVTVPLYQQPVFHTKVARSLQQNVPSEHTLKTADIMDLQIMSSIGRQNAKDVDIDTHYDQLLSSGLEEINDLSEIKNTNRQTEPLDSTKISSHPHVVTSYDLTTISKGPLTEIYEQKVTISLNTDESRLKQNEIDQSKDDYGLESRYSFRKLQQFIEEEPVFRPQRDFTRLRRPPAAVIVTTAVNPNIAIQPTQSVPQVNRPRQRFPSRGRAPPVGSINEEVPDNINIRNGFRGSFARRPNNNFRPLSDRRPVIPSNADNELSVPREPPVAVINPSQPILVDNDLASVHDLLSSLQNSNRNPSSNNEFSSSPVDTESFNGFRPLTNPSGLRRGPGPALEDETTRPDISVRPRRLRITRPVNPDESLNSGIRRVTRLRTSSIEIPSSSHFENEIRSTLDYTPSSEIYSEHFLSSIIVPSDHSEEGTHSLTHESDGFNEGENIASRRTVIRRLKPSFVPGDGSGPRRPVVVRRTKFNEHTSSSTPLVSIEPHSSPTIDDLKDEKANEEESTTTETENENAALNEAAKPPVKKIVRLRKPENGESFPSGHRKRIVISRRPPGVEIIASNTIQGRGPVPNSVRNGHRHNFISDNGHLYPSSENDLDGYDGIALQPNNLKPEDLKSVLATKTFPITYYTSLTYYTTFLHGPNTNYASREALFSNVIEQTLNAGLVSAIKSRNGQISPTNADSILHLASRTLGDTTTIVNLASKQNIYNSDAFKLISDHAFAIEATSTIAQPSLIVTSTKEPNVLQRTPLNAIVSLPKTYLTMFTYSYTFFDGTNSRESTRAETMTNVATDPSDFPTENIGTYIDANGFINVGPETKTNLGSREVEGTTTEVNLGLKTLIKFDGIRDVLIERTPTFQYITPTRTLQLETHSSITSSYDTLRPSIELDSSYPSSNDNSDTSQISTATETSPLFTAGFEDISNNAIAPRQVVKVTSVIHKPSGPLRSGVFEPRPGVRVRVRPVVSRRLVPSDLASSFDISFDVNELSTGGLLASPQYVPHMVVPTPSEPYLTNVVISPDGLGKDNEIASDEFEEGVDEATSSDGMVVPTKKKLKVTVRRQSESVSRTHTRFVLPSRFEITSRPRFYVVTRTGALGVVSNTQRPFTVKISRKVKPTATELGPPSTTVIYDTYTTLTSVPVIFGLDTSFRNVILTTSSPITVSFVPTPTYETEAPIAPSTVVLTFFTTTTFTIPYVVGDETLLTTLEETNSRIVTQTLSGIDTLSYSTITRTPAYEEIIPTAGPITSVEFGFDGPTTHTLSPALKEHPSESPSVVSTPTLYETKTFYTTYTFFSTFFAGTDAVVSSSEQVVTNVVTVPVSTSAIQPSFVSSESYGPLTVIDTSENVMTKTNYNTVTFYATLFSDTSSFVTPIEEVETQIQTITDTYTITRTIHPTPSSSFFPTSISSTIVFMPHEEKSVVVTQTLYTTYTNFVTLFQGSDTVVTNLEEVVTNVVTLTVPAHAASSFSVMPTSPVISPVSETFRPQIIPIYTTREVLSTQTHYLTLFNNDQSLLSSIEEIVTKYVTELVTPTSPSYATDTYFIASSEIFLSSPQVPSYSTPSYVPSESSDTTSDIETYHPELVPSIRTIFSTLTFYTTYFSDTSSIVASQEEVLTSYITLFVPPSLITSSSKSPESTTVVASTSTTDPSVFVFTTTDYSTLTLYTTLFSGNEIVVISSEHVVPEIITATITPSSTSVSATPTADESVLTFLTTFTYYTTYFDGADPVIASSESVVTQFVTIEAPPSVSSTSIEPTPALETILGVSTASGGDISSSFKEDVRGLEIIGVSSAVATGVHILPSIETKIQVESMVHSEVGSTPVVLEHAYISAGSMDEKISPIHVMSSFSGEEDSMKTSVILDSIMTPSISVDSEVLSENNLPVTSRSVLTKETELIGVDGKITTLVPSDTLIMVTGTDGFVTKMAEIDTVALSPVYIPTTKEPSPTASSEIKPATVIELSDLLGGNTALGGDIGLAIQDIVSRITGKKNKTETDGVTVDLTTDLTTEDPKSTEPTTDMSKLTEDTSGAEDAEASSESPLDKKLDGKDDTESRDAGYPVFILPTKSDDDVKSAAPPVYVPPERKSSTVSSSSKTVDTSESKKTGAERSSHTISTSVITGARTVFILPTKKSDLDHTKDEYSLISNTKEGTRASRIEDMEKFAIDSSMTSIDKTTKLFTPHLSPSIGTSVISGIRTIFFGSSSDKTTPSSQSPATSMKEDPILGRANAEIQKPKTFTTITKDGQTVVSRTTSGATTIFFPGQIPKYTNPVTSTRYVTSVESITRTLALTTTRTYYTRDSTLTVPSVYTTTIPPRTFVSTIIGSRTILGILPEPTETVQIHRTIQPSERTTTVTTTTLIFNSIPSTVVRTLVLPTGVPTKVVGSETSSSVLNAADSSIFSAGTEKPARRPDVGDRTSVTNSDPHSMSENSASAKNSQKSRDETYLRAAGPRLYESRPNVRLEETIHRPPILVTESVRPEDDPFLNGKNGVCDPKCQPYKKEVCKENNKLWTCQCRPGHARRDEHDICKEIQTFVILLKVVKMGNDSVNFSSPLADSTSKEYKEFVKNAREGISDAYSITNVKDHIWDAEVNNIMPGEAMQSVSRTTQPSLEDGDMAGVIVNFTLQVSKSVSGELLEQELTRSLQSSGMRVGDSALLAAPLSQNVQDYDECLDLRQNDCALRAKCINLEGSFTCECNEGFEDMDRALPGRICLAKTENCNYCHGRGDCLRGDDEKTFCRCQPMFVGRRCEINGLVLAVALPTAVAVVVFLLCAVLCCCRKCKKKSPSPNTGDPGSVFRGIALKGPVGGTLDRKAMIDTSSESSGEHGRKGVPFEGYQESGDVTPYKSSKRSDLSLNRSLSTGYTSPPVMIPRAKQPQVPNKPMNYTVYDGQVYVW